MLFTKIEFLVVGLVGGVVIFIKSHTIPEEITLNTNLEAVAVKIRFPLCITLCNIYLPNSNSVNKIDLNNLISQLPTPFIILGDFNCHHFYWGSDKCDSRGKMLAEWLDEQDNTVLLNTGQPTHFDSNTGHTSNIDLTLASQNIVSYFEWNALDELYDSDHFPISITTQMFDDNLPNKIKVPKKWKLDKANWAMFSEEVELSLSELPPLNNITNYPINYVVDKFTHAILAAAEKSIPKSSGTVRTNYLPWWNEECKIAQKETKKAFKLYRKYARNDPNSLYKIEYKKKRAYFRRLVKDTRKKYWENWVSTINNKCPIGDMWKKIRLLNNSKTKFNTIVLEKSDGTLTSNPTQTSNLLAESFATNSSSNNYEEHFIEYKSRQEINSNFDVNNNSNPINTKITIREFMLVLSQTGNSSPGPDNIPNMMIKHLPAGALEYLLKIYNYIFEKQVFPDSWREATVIPILKQGKLSRERTSYRPISLTCNFCKLLEKIISKRIRWFVETNRHISPLQYGFRQFRSTTDHLMNIESEILDNYANNNYTILISLDIEKAYEMVWKHRIIKILHDINIKGNSLAFVRNFLSHRSIKVRINDTLSNPVPMENGLPQGSVLSVILFLLAINEILSPIENPTKGFLFADDLTLTCSGRTLKPILKLVQNSLNNLQEWSMKTGFKFSKTKTEYMIVSKKRKISNNIKLYLNNHNIKKVNKLNILGLVFDKKMTWNFHINKLKSDCYKRLNIIKALSSTTWGSDRKCLLNTYRAIIRQKIDYGSVIYDSARKRTLNSLECIQNTALRLAIGAFKTSPIKSILAEAEEMPLELRRKELVITYAINILSQPDNPIYNYYTKISAVDIEYKLNPNLPQPLRIRAKKYLSEFSLKIPELFPKKLLTLEPWEYFDLPINIELATFQKDKTP